MSPTSVESYNDWIYAASWSATPVGDRGDAPHGAGSGDAPVEQIWMGEGMRHSSDEPVLQFWASLAQKVPVSMLRELWPSLNLCAKMHVYLCMCICVLFQRKKWKNFLSCSKETNLKKVKDHWYHPVTSLYRKENWNPKTVNDLPSVTHRVTDLCLKPRCPMTLSQLALLRGAKR